jgi:DNA-binding response OmpR family regulator
MVALTKTERRIYRALQERPRSADELREIVWAHDPNGGPECRHTIYVHIRNLNRRLIASDEIVRPCEDERRYKIVKTPRNLAVWRELNPDAVWVGG